MNKTIMWFFVFVIAVSVTNAAQAHKVIAALYPGVGVVEGEIGFSNGDPAAKALVEVFDTEGKKLGQTQTDDEGFFVFETDVKTDMVFKSDLGAGHTVEISLAGDEVTVASSSSGGESTPSEQATPGPELRKMLAEEVQRAVRPLQREIAAYKEKNDLQTILGGIGYILGLFGIAFYIQARRQKTGK